MALCLLRAWGSVEMAPTVIDLVPVSIETLPDDADGQVECTLSRMVQLAAADASCAEIQRDAQIALHAGRGNPLDGVHSFIRSCMSFATDESQTKAHEGFLPGPDHYFVEALTRPRDISRVIAATGRAKGDCDDFSMYCAALLAALKVPCSFCTVAASGAQPGDYSHVYVVAFVDGIRIPMDCSHGSVVGWETPNRYGRRREWPVYSGSSGTFETAVGIGLALTLFALYKFSRGWQWPF